MTAEENMTVDERRKYLSKMKARYVQADRQAKGQLLDEMEAVTELHRKSLLRLLNGSLERKTRTKQRGRVYGSDVEGILRVIDESFDHICAERQTPNLAQMAQRLVEHDELALSEEALEKLEGISVSTTQRLLKRIRQDEPRLRQRRQSQRGPGVRQDVPMKRLPWDERRPGYFEVDTVHHCGPSAAGEYLCTVQMVDIATGWSERVAVLGRSALVMEDAFRRILARLPFPVRELHPDNGSEFFNHHLLRLWQDKVQGVTLSRSRPYHKNDNRIVEQKNSSLVRAYLGYDRLDTAAQTVALNHLYDKMWVYYNLFQPVLRLEEKTCLPHSADQPGRVTRRYDQARPPFDRLCETDAILEEHQAQLETLRSQTNPRQLRRDLYTLIDQLFALPGAVPGVTENVYHTLWSQAQAYPEDGASHFAFDRTALLS